jgi:hypothetical protein
MRSHISGDKRGSLFISRHWRRPRNCLARCSRSDHVNVYHLGRVNEHVSQNKLGHAVSLKAGSAKRYVNQPASPVTRLY